jgi:pimeloyl-ACP methyl ester carboxylesterase
LRNGQQSVLGVDVIALMDALGIADAIIGGFDWGARTANVVAALWPERCRAIVSVSGYLAEGEAQYDDLEKQLAASPVISVPTITLEGDANGAPHPEPGAYAAKFSGKYAHRTVSGGVGHNLPHEAPQAFAQAIVDVADQR